MLPVCVDGSPGITITFGSRPDLDGQIGTLSFSTGAPSVSVGFLSNATVTVPWPAGDGDIALLTYTLGTEVETAGPLAFPEGCTGTTTTTTEVTTSTSTTTTSSPDTTTTTSTSTTTPTTTTSSPTTSSTTLPSTSTTLPETFTFGAAASVCVSEVPTIRIEFLNQFPSLAGQTGTLTMADLNGNVVSVQSLVYQPGTTVDLLYPGTSINADGSVADVPGWNLNSDGFWVRDPSDEFLREGIVLTYTVNPTATATVTYPPESSACANPDGPFPPGSTTTLPGALPPTA